MAAPVWWLGGSIMARTDPLGYRWEKIRWL